MRPSVPLLILVITALVGRTAAAGEQQRSFTGYAYDLKTRELVYSERHEELSSGDGGEQLRTTYRAPDGRTIAVREVDFSDDRLVPRFQLEDARTGYLEGSRHAGGRVVVYSRETAAEPTEERTISRRGMMVADAGFDRFVLRHWQELCADRRMVVDFLVPSRLGTIAFVIQRHDEGELDGEPTVTFRMTPRNPLLRLLTQPIDVSYHRDHRYLMRYEGMSNVRDAAGDHHVVRIDFPLEERSG